VAKIEFDLNPHVHDVAEVVGASTCDDHGVRHRHETVDSAEVPVGTADVEHDRLRQNCLGLGFARYILELGTEVRFEVGHVKRFHGH